ncbi:MAG: D-alanyl-D-alanine carboxypeptidase [Phycisphaerales bacterium]
MILLKLAESPSRPDEVSWPAGAKVISDWLINNAGLEEGSFRIVDGSGLSRYNLISADSSVRLLAYMKQTNTFNRSSTACRSTKSPCPKGRSGVVCRSPSSNRTWVFAKPGGMSGVATISGYVKTLDGRWLASFPRQRLHRQQQTRH